VGRGGGWEWNESGGAVNNQIERRARLYSPIRDGLSINDEHRNKQKVRSQSVGMIIRLIVR